MVLDYNEIVEVIECLAKKLNLKLSEANLETLCKKVEHQNLAVTLDHKEIKIMNPGVKSGFFFKNVSLLFEKPYTNKFFDEDLITDIKLNKNKVIISDLNNNKIEVEKDNVKVQIPETIPLELYMNLMN